MKIAIITEAFFPNIGGMEVSFLELGRILVKDGHDVEVYTLRLSSSDPTEGIIDSIRIHRITNAFRYFKSIWGLRNYPDVIRFTIDLIKSYRGLNTFDFIIFNIWPVVPAIILPQFIKSKMAVYWCEVYDKPFWRFIYRLITLFGPKLHCGVNQNICDFLQLNYQIPKNHLKVLISGVNAKLYQCDRAEKRDRSILFFGRLAQHKDPEAVIQAFLERQLDQKGYELNIVGGGPLFKLLIGRYQHQSGIKIHGSVEEDRKIEFLQQASLLVLPSKREGFPRVCAEAAAAGTPILTVLYPSNGTVNVVTQYGIGWLSNPNLTELAEKIERYGSIESEEWKLMSSRCQRMAKTRFDWDIVAQEFLEIARTEPS
jgi:glycosyltransferase involved in cell wall biosynthesis